MMLILEELERTNQGLVETNRQLNSVVEQLYETLLGLEERITDIEGQVALVPQLTKPGVVG